MTGGEMSLTLELQGIARARLPRSKVSPEDVLEAIEQAKREISWDMRQGVVGEVEGFSDLHDFVDANEYGGLCAARAGWSIETVALVQDALDAWLRAGRP